MDNDPGIICFKHCMSDIFTFSLPDRCPVCYKHLDTERQILPFRKYTNSQDLHIGVTDSYGVVHAYDKRGLCKGYSEEWEQCLALPARESPQLVPVEEQWDAALLQLAHHNLWTPQRYEENGLNCYSFVLKFLNTIPPCTLNKFSTNKELFCQHVLLPQTITAAKYISLFRRVSSQGIYVQSKE